MVEWKFSTSTSIFWTFLFVGAALGEFSGQRRTENNKSGASGDQKSEAVINAKILVSKHGACGDKKLEHCNCTRPAAGGGVVVICVDEEFEDTDVFLSIPDDADEVTMRGNYFYEMPDTSLFGLDRRMEVRLLDLDNNRIQMIHGHTFNRMPELETLVLSHNQLYISNSELANAFHKRVFSNLPKLRQLSLDDAFSEMIVTNHTLPHLAEIFHNSQLENLVYLDLSRNQLPEINGQHNGIDNKLFCNMRNIEEIKLARNKLHHINLDPTCLTKLEHLDLSYNSFLNFDAKTLRTFDSMQSLKDLDISGNPFMCDCRLKDFHRWLKSTNKIKEAEKAKFICANSFEGRHNGHSLLHTQYEDLECEVPEHKMRSAYAMLLVVVFVLVLLMVVLGYMNRKTILACIWGVARPLSRKKYYHIENDSENAEFHV